MHYWNVGEWLHYLKGFNQNQKVKIGFKNIHPWKGPHGGIAFEPENKTTVKEMIKSLNKALGTTIKNSKGQDEEINMATLVNFDHKGEYSKGECEKSFIRDMMIELRTNSNS